MENDEALQLNCSYIILLEPFCKQDFLLLYIPATGGTANFYHVNPTNNGHQSIHQRVNLAVLTALDTHR